MSNVEIVCGAKLKGVSSKRPSKSRREHMRKSPCSIMTFHPDNPDHQKIASDVIENGGHQTPPQSIAA